METLENAIRTAAVAHSGQVDKASAAYILHPLRLMCRAKTETEKMVAVLHDVVEDTDWTLARLRELAIPEEVLVAVDCLTRRGDETYEAFIERTKTNRLALAVKLADLEDNMDIYRLGTLTPKDMDRLNKYKRAREVLMAEQ